MDEKTVRSLEKQIEAAVLEAISDIELKRVQPVWLQLSRDRKSLK